MLTIKYKYDALVNQGEEINNSSAKQETNKSTDKQTAEGKMSFTDEIPLGKLRETALRVSQMEELLSEKEKQFKAQEEEFKQKEEQYKQRLNNSSE